MGKPEVKQPVKMAAHWKWLLFAAGVFFPVAIMLFFYTRNAGYVRFDFVLAICGIMMLISAAAWWVAYWLFRSPLSSFSICVIGWMGCYVTSSIINFIQLLFPISHYRSLFKIAITALLALLAALLLRRRGVDGKAALFVSVMVGVLLLMNGLSSFRAAFAIQSDTNIAKKATVKTDFVVTKARAGTPNVYWFHCDGMLGFASMEKYFGDSQDEFLQALADRGFAVNKDAMLESGHTSAIAIPALMCPDSYDQWLGVSLSSHEKAMQFRSKIFYNYRLSVARFNNETIRAFESAGYTSHIIAELSSYFYPTTDFFYFPSGYAAHTKLGEKNSELSLLLIDYIQLEEFLNIFVPALGVLLPYVWDRSNIIKDETIMKPVLTEEELQHTLLSNDGILKYAYIANALKYSLTGNTPRLTVVFSPIAHYPYYFNKDGTVFAEKKNMEIMSYPAQHRYAAKVLINLVDMILRKDPNAVIVLQSDHGLHGNKEEEFAKYFRNTNCAIDLWNSVMSAMRVPEQFRNGEESYALSNPLNMSRYVVNNFGGRNYKYISKN